MSRALPLAIAGLLALGFAGGIACDPTPKREPVYRGDYRVLEGDFHMHTTFSDGSLTPLGIVRQAERHALDVVALTEHNTALPALFARRYARAIDGPVVLVGEEVTTSRFHIIAVGLERTVLTHHEAKDVIADIHAQGGLAIAAHPVQSFWPALLPVRDQLDGAELMHPIAYSSRAGWRWADMVTFYDESPRRLTAVGSSDYHWGSILGLCRTFVFLPRTAAVEEAPILRALHEGKTVVLDRDGIYRGDPELVTLLEREPYQPRPADYRYVGEGAGDRLLRTLGWLGLVALVVLGRRRRSA